MKGPVKPVLPSLREKKRYIAFEVVSHGKCSFRGVSKALWLSLLSFAGDAGAAGAGMSVLEDLFSVESQHGVVRVAHTAQDVVKASLVLISEVDGEGAVMRSLGSSGVLARVKALAG